MNNETAPTLTLEEKNERLTRINAQLRKEVEAQARERAREERTVALVTHRPPARYDVEWFARALDFALERETVMMTLLAQFRRENEELREDLAKHRRAPLELVQK